jgi:D-serine deaminase-like pyridoxal phosphate-dependent protein
MSDWYRVVNAGEVPSPAVLVYADRLQANLRRMVAITGGSARLRPHVKTHKVAEIIRRQLEMGIARFKCATLAEAEMVAGCGGTDVLIAYQPVGPNVGRLLDLMGAFPRTAFSVVVDDADAARELSRVCSGAGRSVEVLLDLDLGMHRTGVPPDGAGIALYERLSNLPGIRPGGLHAYDGHIHDSDVRMRTRACEEALAPVLRLRERLAGAGMSVPRLVVGGTPTFAIHARRADVECSPGTCVLWDAGYGSKFPDLGFEPAAVVLTRVVSRPGGNRLCLDLGHKAIASEMPHPRVQFLDLADAKPVMHSEEHLVIETERAGEFAVGDCLYGVPWHICPTMALHAEVVVVEQGRAGRRWEVTARSRATKAESRGTRT